MERIILWGTLIIALILLFFSFQKLPLKNLLIIFLFSSYISVLAGTFVVEEKMLAYPVKLLDIHFQSSIQFEMLILPVFCLYFYITTYHSNFTGIILQGLLYTAALTFAEFLLERYTDLIEYYTWSWVHTFISVLILILFLRFFIIMTDKNQCRK